MPGAPSPGISERIKPGSGNERFVGGKGIPGRAHFVPVVDPQELPVDQRPLKRKREKGRAV